MKRMAWLLGVVGTAVTATVGHAQNSASPTPSLIRVWEFTDVRPAAFDEGMGEFRAYLGSRTGYWSYSYYAGDDGHRYISSTLSGLADIGRQDSITSAFVRDMPGRDAFLAKWNTLWGSANQTIWQSMPALSSPPSGMTSAQISAKYPYRRSTTRYVRPEMQAEFEATIREIKALDARVGSGIPVVVYQMVLGAGEPAYLLVSYAESGNSYWDLFEERRVKRAADPAWSALSRRLADTQRDIKSVSLTRNPALSYAP